MAKLPTRAYSHYSRDAVSLLGQLVRRARIERRITAAELAERAGLSRGLVQRIEKGDPGCAIGAVFEAAAVVGVRLFDAAGQDLVNESTSVAGFTGCSSANSGTAVMNFYTQRGQAAHASDGCTSRNFAAGVFTFSVTPSASGSVSSPSSGEVLFEVTLGH